MIAYLLFAAALIVAVICTLLVFDRDYEDGLFGRIALAAIAIASFARAIGILERGFDLHLGAIPTVLWLGLAVFFARHYYRFRMWRASADHAWRPADKFRRRIDA